MQIFRISYQEITFLCLLNIKTICYRVHLHGPSASCSCVADSAWKCIPLGSEPCRTSQEEHTDNWPLTAHQMTYWRTGWMHMLAQDDSVCSSEQSRDDYDAINIGIKLPPSLIKKSKTHLTFVRVFAPI